MPPHRPFRRLPEFQPSTVKRYLDVWKKTGWQRGAQVPVPDATVEGLESLGRDFWAPLEARIVALKAELDRAIKQTEAERQAAAGACKAAQAAAVEGAALKGELAAQRGSKP